MRGGPGLGTIQPSQADYFQAVKGGGHGDYHLIVLAPSTVQEMVDFVGLGFDLCCYLTRFVANAGNRAEGNDEIVCVLYADFLPSCLVFLDLTIACLKPHLRQSA